MKMNYCVYRTAHGAFKDSIPNEFTAFIFPLDAPIEQLIGKIGNCILFSPGDAVHFLHWARVFDVIRGKEYPPETLEAVREGQIRGRIIMDECVYCDKRLEREGPRCKKTCTFGLTTKYRDLPFDVERLEGYLERNRWDRVSAVLLHRDEVFVRMRSKDIAQGRLRQRADNEQGYNPKSLTFEREILQRNELIFNAEMAERTGRMKALKFRDD
jgi:hypothetical protein